MLQISSKRKWLKPDFIEDKARARLLAYEDQFGRILQPPIPVNHLIEAHLGLVVDWDDIPEETDDTILAYIDPQTRCIRMNASRRDHFDQFIGTETFTLAHEVGHWDLHVVEAHAVQLSLLGDIASRSFICRSSDKNGFEWQANRYAAALIMPAPMVRDYAETLDLCCWHTLYALKDEFGVTISALTTRLEELGLVYRSADNKLYPSKEAFVGQEKLL